VTIRFLLDENVAPQIRDAALRKYPHLDIVCVGDDDCPPKGTPDEAILRFVAETQRILITRNRKSIPGHVSTVEKQGMIHWGVFRVRAETTYSQLIEELYLLAEASDSSEWVGQLRWIPF
jgi:hypothetical protein